MKLREVVRASEARASRLRRSALRSYEVFAPVPEGRDAASRPAAIEGATTTSTAATLATLGLAAASWVVAVRQMNGMDIGVATELGSFAFFVAVWVSMMAAMTLPGAAPAVSRQAPAAERGHRCTAGAGDPRAWSPDRDRALVRPRTHATDVDVRPHRSRGPGQS
jgi:hypothetical protein